MCQRQLCFAHAAGALVVKSVTVTPRPSFLDYIQGEDGGTGEPEGLPAAQ